ncbi:MAG: HAMP domain-containing histidine kinase [Clostridia bacterium]|nr:HAMP domain-containing histidine kinase [Clostridia bacterium]
MIKARNKFVLFAILSVSILLTVLLAVINGINFSMASEDADQITQMIARGRGAFEEGAPLEQGRPQMQFGRGGMGTMGPNSPEVANSVRYFTVAPDESGESKVISMHISEIDESEALALAESLIKSGKTTGWTNLKYRYRVYKNDTKTFVTVIDQGRELLPSYRILIFSIIGELAGIIISFAFLMFIGKRLFSPLEEADRKQKIFICDAEKEFKIPLTVINANVELIERTSGTSEQTQAINRQVKKMSALVKDLGSLAIFDDGDTTRLNINLSEALNAKLDESLALFEQKNIALSRSVEDGVTIKGDADAIRRSIAELVENSAKFAVSSASFELKNENGRVILRQINDTTLPSGNIEQIFDRFTTLENADDEDGHGIGLSIVKDTVKTHNGRTTAKVEDGRFILEIML